MEKSKKKNIVKRIFVSLSLHVLFGFFVAMSIHVVRALKNYFVGTNGKSKG